MAGLTRTLRTMRTKGMRICMSLVLGAKSWIRPNSPIPHHNLSVDTTELFEAVKIYGQQMSASARHNLQSGLLSGRSNVLIQGSVRSTYQKKLMSHTLIKTLCVPGNSHHDSWALMARGTSSQFLVLKCCLGRVLLLFKSLIKKYIFRYLFF